MIIAVQTLIFFRESLLTVIDRFLKPYYKKLSFPFNVNETSDYEDDDSDEHVFAEFHEEKGVVFFPPVYSQRYAAVVDCLMDDRWCGELEKVVDFGYHDISFIKYLKDVPGIKHILGVDIESISLRCSSDLLGCDNYLPKRESPLHITLFKGNAADPDYRLIGCDAVIAIEMIEHMLPHDLERFVHTVFGFIKPRIIIITTPNGDFNVLFKSLEMNGLRRLDHFFEWSREQFHDWCSNIVSRYPQYTVVSKGIGPGPPGTLHLGCCSQLALFVAKDYQKQPDLNLESLALIAKAPSPNNLSDISDSWESPGSISDDMLCIENNDEFYTKLPNDQSYMSIVFTSPKLSETLEYKDKILQCNLDIELAKNFLMFDDEVSFNVITPRRKKMNIVYEIEDVACRLNCSTLQVKKFSKISQGLMAKNKTDSFAHTREVVEEIRHLTKLLNFNKSDNKLQGYHTWCNINWGDNAPYWNQYYKVVREYNYPFQVKSDETRILDAVSEEINRLIDSEDDQYFSEDTQKLEIPIDHLMNVLDFITTDVDKVIDLLQWNGYKVVDNVVVHSRLVVDTLSLNTQEDWTDDAITDWDTTDVRSTSLSDGSMNIPDSYDGCLRRALDSKIRKIRTLLTADEDITTELDRIVCRLMKLALNTSKGREDPPSVSWMQYKLFDLLTLTERAIEKRRCHYLKGFSLKAIEYYNEEINRKNIITSNILKANNNTTKGIVSKYFDLVASSDFEYNDNFQEDQLSVFDSEDIISIISNDLNVEREYETEYVDVRSDHFIIDEMVNLLNDPTDEFVNINTINKVKKPQSLEKFDDNISYLDPCPEYVVDFDNTTPISKYFDISNEANNVSNLSVPKPIGAQSGNKYKRTKKHKHASIKTKQFKKVKSKIGLKFNGHNKTKRRRLRDHQVLQSTLSKPIPNSLIEIGNPKRHAENKSERPHNNIISENLLENPKDLYKLNDIAATEDSLYIVIVTDCGEETIVLRRNIGMSPETDFEISDNEAASETVINVSKDDDSLIGMDVDEENVTSQTIFIYDINQPSTSKGFQHLSADVQCGPDVSLTCATISATTSLTAIPKIFSNKLKIKDSITQVNKTTSDFGTCTGILNDPPKVIGITIKDSEKDYYTDAKYSIMTQVSSDDPTLMTNTLNSYQKETKLLKPPFCTLKNEDSGSGLCNSLLNLQKSLSQFVVSPKNTSDVKILSVTKNENVVVKRSQNFICGGIHVHSFKEKFISEDVVYQGDWQRTRTMQRKKSPHVCSKRSSSLSKRRKHSTIVHTNIMNTVKNLNIYQQEKHKKLTVRKIKINNPNKKANRERNNNINNIITEKNHNMKPVVKATPEPIIRARKIKSAKTYSRQKPSIESVHINQKKEEPKNHAKKNYIPKYLRRRIIQRSNANDNFNIDVDHMLKSDKEKTSLYSMAAEITKDLLKLTENVRNKNNFLVFFNENLTRDCSGKKKISVATEIINSDSASRNVSPPTRNSSTSSSPNSVKTVRGAIARKRTIPNRREFPSSEKNSSDFENEIKSKINSKICSTRYKNHKKSPNRTILLAVTKENIPESSQNIDNLKNDIQNNSKCTFAGNSTSTFLLKTHTEKLKIQSEIKNNEEESVAKFNKNYNEDFKEIFNYYSDTDDSQNSCFNKSFSPSVTFHNIIELDTAINSNNVETSNMQISNSKKSINRSKSSIMSAIRQLIEDKINITENNSHDSLISGSETVILNKSDIYDCSINDSSSPLSIETVISNEESYENTIEDAFVSISSPNKNESLLSSDNVEPQVAEFDSLSFKSSDLVSVSDSKFSEYYLADNELENTILPQIESLNVSSVHELFERRNRNNITNVNGLTIQAFSGFSINAGSFVGDRPDSINLVDSETGSLTFDSARQAASEEVFVSGRSSDTYESCFVEDDTYVPSWLFNIISQQQSISESENENAIVPMPLEDPLFDANGNAIEPEFVIGAGAGDGRGMHSDRSQDSSGRAASLSSSATSSG